MRFCCKVIFHVASVEKKSMVALLRVAVYPLIHSLSSVCFAGFVLW